MAAEELESAEFEFEWSFDNTSQLINLYETFPCLYAITFPRPPFQLRAKMLLLLKSFNNKLQQRSTLVDQQKLNDVEPCIIGLTEIII